MERALEEATEKVIVNYWEPTKPEPGGHCSIKVDHKHGAEFISFWCDATNSEAKPTTPIFVESPHVESQIVALRILSYTEFESRKLIQPSGAKLYLKILEELKIILDEVSKKNKESAISHVETKLLLSSEPDQNTALVNKALAKSLTNFIQSNGTENFSSNYYTHLEDIGRPTEKFEVSQLSVTTLLKEWDSLKRLAKDGKLLWAGQVGSKTDKVLEESKENLTLYNFIPGADSMPGKKGYIKGCIRHNCTSILLYLMEVAGLTCKNFDESKYVSSALKKMVEIRSEQDPEIKNDWVMALKASAAGSVSTGIKLVTRNYNYPISNLFGTIPEVFSQIVQTYIAESTLIEADTKETSCSIS